MRSATLRSAFLAFATCVFAACTGNDVAPVESPGQTDTRLILVLSAQVDTVPEATSKPLIARVTDASGILRTAPVSWTSTNPAVATVSGGLVTGVTPGTAWVIASAGAAADTAQIVVIPNELTLDVQPAAAVVARGDTLHFVATIRSRSGEIVAVNQFTWTSSDTNAASIVGAGAVKTKQEGDVTITAEALARQGGSTIKIFQTPVGFVSITPSTANVYKGSTVQLLASVFDKAGRVVPDPDVTWGSSDYSTASVDADGLVTGMKVGPVIITATCDGKTASAAITVMSPPAVSLSLVLPKDTTLVGVEEQATATPLDASGQPLTGKTIAWQSSNPAVATVTASGLVKGIAQGNSNISAIVDGIIATRRLSVLGRVAASISVLPGAPSVTVGQAAQLSARVLDQYGTEIVGQGVSWASSNTSVATVSGSGLLTGRTAGSATITAYSGSITQSVTVSVVSVPVASAKVSPTSASLSAGGQVTLAATAYAADGTVLAGRPVSWMSLSPSVATVSSSGVVSAVAAGSAIVRATIEGVSADASISVAAPAPASVAVVVVTIANPALSVGQSTQASAVTKDASGNVITGTSVSWSSLDPTVATVSSSGMVTAIGGGTVTIIGRSQDVNGYASVAVNTPLPAAVASVSVTSPSTNLLVGQSAQTSVTLKDAQGNVLSGRTITYSTENPGIISVSASGVVTGVGAGTTRILATSEGITGSLTFTVTSAPSSSPTVSSITVSAPSTSLLVGGTTQATAAAKDAQGNVMSGTSFTWTTSNPGVATVSGSGLVTAVGAGSATIMAAASGVTGSLAMSVSAPAPATVASVTVSLSTASILVGGTSQGTAVAKDAQGVVITGRTVSWSSSAASIATVSSAGLATGVASGAASIRATIDGVVGSTSLTVSSPPPPASSTSVELPRTYLNFPFPTKTGQTILVGPGGNLQAALNNAQRGDEVVLTAGATYTGNFVLPAKSGTAANGWIVIRSDQVGQLPALGTRVTAAQAGLMAKLETPNTAPALKTAAGASGWRLVGLEVTVASAVTAQQYGLVNLGEAGSPQTTLASVPTDLVLDRLYIHGQPTTNMSRCVALNSARTQVSDSYIVECHGKGFDSQAIWGGNGPGPFRIVNNTLEAAGENIMFGGSDPTIAGLVPSDIEIRQNYLYTPVSWKGVWTKKNLLELKNGVRVLIEGNVLDGSWLDAQTGWAVIMKSGNQSGACRWCRTTDVTFRRNLVQNVGAGINVAAYGDLGPSGTDTATRRIYLGENVLNVGAQPGDSRGFQMLVDVQAVTLERNVLAGNFTAAALTEGGAYCTFKDNVWARGQYGVIASGASPGTPSVIKGCGSTYAWTGITLVGSSNGTYPAGTTWVASESAAPLATTIRTLVQQATAGVR